MLWMEERMLATGSGSTGVDQGYWQLWRDEEGEREGRERGLEGKGRQKVEEQEEVICCCWELGFIMLKEEVTYE